MPATKKQARGQIPWPVVLLVARTRFELVIFALRGRCPKPLDERAKVWNRQCLVFNMVARTRFELVIFALRGRCPKPLDERAMLLSSALWLG